MHPDDVVLVTAELSVTWRRLCLMTDAWMRGKPIAAIAADGALTMEDVERCIRLAVQRL